MATEPTLAAPEALELDEAAAALQKEQLLADGALAAARVREILEGVIDYSGSTRSGAAPSPLADFAPGATAVAGTASAVAGAAPVPPAPAAAAPAPAPAPAKRKVAPAGATLGSPLVLGLSHKTATVEVREKLSIPEHRWNEASAALCEYDSINEAAVISTCNRFEVYLVTASTPSPNPTLTLPLAPTRTSSLSVSLSLALWSQVAEDHYAAARDAMAYLKEHSQLDDKALRPNLFMLLNSDAVWHLLHVAAGLDSLVIGEGQILSQVKACYSHAIAPGGQGEEGGDEIPGSAQKVLGRLLNTAVMSGKFVRSETGIAKGAVSISSAAVELAVLKSVDDLDKPLSEARVTIIGAGKMSRLLITHLASHGVTKLTLLNRSRKSAEEMAAEYPDVDIRVGLMDELWETMEQSDMAFTSTSATDCILTKANLGERVWGEPDAPGKPSQPLVLIDISVPRNVESQCNEVGNVKAYNVDDLKAVVAKNQAERKHKVIQAEMLLRIELQKFEAWQESLKYVPTISRLQAKMEKVRAAETAKTMKKALKGLSDKERQAVETVTKGIINKLLHSPMAYLRSDSKGDKATVSQIEEIFGLRD